MTAGYLFAHGYGNVPMLLMYFFDFLQGREIARAVLCCYQELVLMALSVT